MIAFIFFTRFPLPFIPQMARLVRPAYARVMECREPLSRDDGPSRDPRFKVDWLARREAALEWERPLQGRRHTEPQPLLS
jgi:hypothetical protein